MSKYILFSLFLFSFFAGHSQTASISGVISTHSGSLIPNTKVTLKANNFEQIVQTDTNGVYLFTEVPTGETYTLEMEREGEILNGVSAFDLVQMMQNILALPVLETSAEQLSGDVDESGTLSIRDVWLLRNLILGISTSLEAPTWRFVPVDYSYPDAIIPQIITFNQDIENLNFLGVKAGDVNGSARF